ncbi:MAG: Hsp20/alpha crystallin family protein, partial [Gammaproteobacteria bacterium]|nr:Hsp20/alpha crystallin family protein [Gammaproteobacteria bacterium]
MTSKIFIITVAALIGMSISLTASAFSFGSGSSNPGTGERGMRPMAGFSRRSSGGIRFEKGMDEKGYYLTVHMGGMRPEDLLIKPMNGSLMISSSQMSQSETHDQAAGRSYRFSRSFGSFNRRISLPFDADAENMERTDSDG